MSDGNMNENQFWIKVVKTIGTVICVLCLSMTGCTVNRHYQTRVLIENAKVDPIEARCALDSDSLGYTACVMIASKKESK